MTASVKRPSLISSKRWETRRAHYLAVFEGALVLLRQCRDLPEDEPNLTRELWFKLTTARRGLDPDGRFGHPIPQADNLPDPNAAELQAYEYKRPDFQWHHDDSQEDDRHAMKAFAIECKRLGAPTASGWQLNVQYVIAGINRFHDPSWRYGHGMAEGAMVGFVQDMDFDTIAKAVELDCQRMGFGRLIRDPRGWQVKSVSRLINSFGRSFPASSFQLFHLWLDIRDVSRRPKGPTPRTTKNKKQSQRKRVTKKTTSPRA